MANDLLKNLCDYYLNCISLESGNTISQPLSGRGKLQYIPVSGLEINPELDRSLTAFLIGINMSKDLKAYLGYPIRIYTSYEKSDKPSQRIAPVFLFPIDYQGGKASIRWQPFLNMEVLKAFSESSIQAITELNKLENELGLDSSELEIDAAELVSRLYSIRQWDWAEPIIPSNIPHTEDLRSFPNGIYNRPIIIAAERGKYTHGLESELLALSNLQEDSYKGTALYSWINGIHEEYTNSYKPLLEVLPLNSEQTSAVETALSSDLTIVTGPPGTGKSQVVTDLLINLAWNGRSVLFSSKNNKAVNVVEARVNGLCNRPVLLHMTSPTVLAEIIDGILHTNATETDKEDVEYYTNEYNIISDEVNILKQQKKSIIDARNELDIIEQKYCNIRSKMACCFNSISEKDQGAIVQRALAFRTAHHRSIKENNGLLTRLFWKRIGLRRKTERDLRANDYNDIANKYQLAYVVDQMTEHDVDRLCDDAKAFETDLATSIAYKKALNTLEKLDTLEGIDKKLSDKKKYLSGIAYKLWVKWLRTQSISLSAWERKEMADYVAMVKMIGAGTVNDPSVRKRFNEMSKKMSRFLSCWAVTSLSAKGKIPFEAGRFDYVIIDEASQCDIASMIPLLFRAKRAVIIGDPKQLSHISQLTGAQDLALLQRFHVSPAWSYSSSSLYSLASSIADQNSFIQLKDHFRSCSEIIEFSNEAFYDGSLRTATDYQRLIILPNEEPGIRWIDIKGHTVRPESGSAYNIEEAHAVVNELKRVLAMGYKGSIGVTTPFRKQAEEIRRIIEYHERDLLMNLQEHMFIADTVHKFQGDERDMMLFSPVVSDGALPSSISFLNCTGNLFNVAITRARAVLMVVGDYNYCCSCNVSYLKEFANYYARISSKKQKQTNKEENAYGREYPWIANPEQVSEWEKVLYTALYDAGIKTIPQLKVEKYKLDLAVLLENGKKLDIEVDGEMYHRSWNGELCYRDQLRTQRLFELGWDVKRFWVYQIRDEMMMCISEISRWIDNNTQVVSG